MKHGERVQRGPRVVAGPREAQSLGGGEEKEAPEQAVDAERSPVIGWCAFSGIAGNETPGKEDRGGQGYPRSMLGGGVQSREAGPSPWEVESPYRQAVDAEDSSGVFCLWWVCRKCRAESGGKGSPRLTRGSGGVQPCLTKFLVEAGRCPE